MFTLKSIPRASIWISAAQRDHFISPLLLLPLWSFQTIDLSVLFIFICLLSCDSNPFYSRFFRNLFIAHSEQPKEPVGLGDRIVAPTINVYKFLSFETIVTTTKRKNNKDFWVWLHFYWILIIKTTLIRSRRCQRRNNLTSS